jgi:hypothetical protein
VPNFAELAQPLYEVTRESELFTWTEDQEKAFAKIKQALLSAPTLGLLNITKPFHLFVDERKGIEGTNSDFRALE